MKEREKGRENRKMEREKEIGKIKEMKCKRTKDRRKKNTDLRLKKERIGIQQNKNDQKKMDDVVKKRRRNIRRIN